jgi:hypothetical protein
MLNFKKMDPSINLDKKVESGPGIDELQEAQRIEKTKEYQEKFVDKVDPFGKNVKKKVIKTSTIKFKAEEPQAFGKAKQANLPEAQIRRGHTGYDAGEIDDLEDVSEAPRQESSKPKRLVVKKPEKEAEQPRERKPAVVDEVGSDSDDERAAMEAEKARMRAELEK